MRRHELAAVAVTLLTLLSGSVVRAQEPERPELTEASERHDLGVRLFEQGDYASALAEFDRVYALLEGRPGQIHVVYNIARVNHVMGRHRQALEGFERYLRESPPDAPNRLEAQRGVRELRLRLQLEDQDRGGGFSLSPLGLAIAGVGAASVIAGAIVGGLALAQDGDARADCEATRCTPGAYAAIGEAGLFANVADGLLWGGLAVLATGLVLTFVLAENGTSATASCSGEGCAAVVRGRF